MLALGAALATVVSLSAPGPVTALAADGQRVAFASGRGAGDCDRVRIWSPKTGRVVRLGRTTACVQTSTGTGVAAVSIAGRRVLWLHYTGGNIREWSLFTASQTAPKPRRLRFVTLDVDSAPPIVVGDGDASRLGGLLPYAVGREVVALRADGGRRFAWTAPGRVVALSALGGELAVASEGGRVTVLDLAGRTLREESYAGELSAVKLTGAGVLVQRGRTLEHRNGVGVPWAAVLPASARLVDAAGTTDALYVVRGVVRARRIGGARDVVVGRGAFAQVEGRSLATAGGRKLTAREPYAR